ncbi:MAG: GDP-mannose 4,6-dehydratase [Gemmatimonadetes bacterium]|nr:GDP-mannose 4,6-dehydratase [Gemmatimonadota bacterium]
MTPLPSNSSILVTGAAGFLGSHLSESLVHAGHRVVGLDSFDNFYDRAIKEQNLSQLRAASTFSLVEGDIRDGATLDSLPSDVSLVVHLAAKAGVRPSIEDPQLYSSVNVDGTWRLLDWMRQRGIPHFVFASSSSVYGNCDVAPFREDLVVDRPISPYAATKLAGELACHTYHHLHDLSVLALRFFTIYGPRQRPDLAIHKFARLMRAGQSIPMFGDGSTERDYTYIDDILQGILASIDLLRRSEPLFEIVNLGESRTVSLHEMIQVLGEEMGVEPAVDQKPMQPGDVERTYADVSKARALLAYEPSVEFRDGVRMFLEWFDDPERSG